jgi:ribosomal protein L3 glutamine methyltransferase
MPSRSPRCRRIPARAGTGARPGDDGLDFTRIILREAKKHLTDQGMLVVEIGHNREALEAAYPRLPFTWLDTTAGDDYVFLLNAADLPD